jgi:hypothetical protein
MDVPEDKASGVHAEEADRLNGYTPEDHYHARIDAVAFLNGWKKHSCRSIAPRLCLMKDSFLPFDTDVPSRE